MFLSEVFPIRDSNLGFSQSAQPHIRPCLNPAVLTTGQARRRTDPYSIVMRLRTAGMNSADAPVAPTILAFDHALRALPHR